MYSKPKSDLKNKKINTKCDNMLKDEIAEMEEYIKYRNIEIARINKLRDIYSIKTKNLEKKRINKILNANTNNSDVNLLYPSSIDKVLGKRIFNLKLTSKKKLYTISSSKNINDQIEQIECNNYYDRLFDHKIKEKYITNRNEDKLNIIEQTKEKKKKQKAEELNRKIALLNNRRYNIPNILSTIYENKEYKHLNI